MVHTVRKRPCTIIRKFRDDPAARVILRQAQDEEFLFLNENFFNLTLSLSKGEVYAGISGNLVHPELHRIRRSGHAPGACAYAAPDSCGRANGRADS